MILEPVLMDKNRSCFHCRQFTYCWTRLEIHRILIAGEIRLINIDSDKHPAKFSDIFSTLGNACMFFVAKTNK